MPPLATLRYGAARAAGGLPEGPPPPTQDPKGGAGATPRHTALYGAARAAGGPPEGPPPPPPDPRAAPAPPLAILRHGAARAPGGLPEGPPPPPTSDPAPPEIGRGSKRALTHPPESLTASCEAGAKPPRIRDQPALKGDHGP